jgi:hypothetical protein
LHEWKSRLASTLDGTVIPDEREIWKLLPDPDLATPFSLLDIFSTSPWHLRWTIAFHFRVNNTRRWLVYSCSGGNEFGWRHTLQERVMQIFVCDFLARRDKHLHTDPQKSPEKIPNSLRLRK